MVDETLIQDGVNKLQNSLIEKLSLVTGDKPYSLEDLHLQLGQIWRISGAWNLVPLDKGYYNIQLLNLEDKNRILD